MIRNIGINKPVFLDLSSYCRPYIFGPINYEVWNLLLIGEDKNLSQTSMSNHLTFYE